MLAFCFAVGCASSIYCRINYFLVTCGNYFLSYKYFVAHGAVLAFCFTVGRACSIYCRVYYFLVAAGNYFLSYKYFVAYGAVLAFCFAVGCAGSFYCRVNNFLVATGNYFLGYKYSLAHGAVLTFCKSIGGACSIYRGIYYFCMGVIFTDNTNFISNYGIIRNHFAAYITHKSFFGHLYFKNCVSIKAFKYPESKNGNFTGFGYIARQIVIRHYCKRDVACGGF